MDLSWVDWGDAPTWFGTLAAVAAAFFTGLVYVSQRRLSAQQDELIRKQQEVLAKQSAQLTAELTDRRATAVAGVEYSVAMSLPQPRVQVTNHSKSPIYGVSVRWGQHHLQQASINGDLGPTVVDAVRPGSNADFAPSVPDHSLGYADLRLYFRDCDGFWWEIDGHMARRNVPHPPP